jgi:hypothetical protein
MLADHPRFPERRGSVVYRLQIDTAVSSAIGKGRAHFVITNQCQECRAAPERGNISRGIRCASEDPSDIVNSDDGYWRFRGYSAALA